ncbi:MAG: efflux RND transporter periplasmic adaptor subunit [Rhodanobacter sp.]
MKDKVMRGKRAILIAAAIGIASAIAGCKETAAPASLAKPPSVPVAKVLVRPVTSFAEFNGSLTAVKRVELRPRVAGYIQGVSVPEGRFVEKGHKLFLIDPRGFQATLDAAKARLREAEAASVLARAEYDRAKQLFAKKVVARDRLDTVTASLNAKTAQVDATKAAVDAAHDRPRARPHFAHQKITNTTATRPQPHGRWSQLRPKLIQRKRQRESIARVSVLAVIR